ncbi:MAG: sigma-70 family RNA polymerase sigma factor [Saprospiraceae bacterium]|nr:sigma-70 family RNA polymerase sigma factor [Saprospiraceae bacterium]
MNDEQLWESLKKGDQQAFQQVYDSHIESLLQYGCRFCKDRETVEDSLHDLFIYIWKNREGLSSTDSIQRYLMVALRRRIIQSLKRRSSELDENSLGFACDLSIEEQWIMDEENEEAKSALQGAFEKLSARQREAIYLKYYQQLSYEAICEVMDLNYQSARNLIFNSIQTLRKVMTLIFLVFFLLVL